MPPLLDAARLLLAEIDGSAVLVGSTLLVRPPALDDLRRAVAAAEKANGRRCNACGLIVNLANPRRPRLRPDSHWFDSLTRGPRLIDAQEMGGDEQVARELRW